MKYYEVWKGDLYLDIFSEVEVNEMREGGAAIGAYCVSVSD